MDKTLFDKDVTGIEKNNVAICVIIYDNMVKYTPGA